MVASISCCPRTLVVALFCFLLLTLQANSLRITGATNGTNPTTGERPFRREINEFAGSGASWDLYILALQRMQSAPSNDPLSYYQIAGIHGYPNVSWDGVAGSGSAVGYCMHRSVLFAIWHRPYLALFEVSEGSSTSRTESDPISKQFSATPYTLQTNTHSIGATSMWRLRTHLESRTGTGRRSIACQMS